MVVVFKHCNNDLDKPVIYWLGFWTGVKEFWMCDLSWGDLCGLWDVKIQELTDWSSCLESHHLIPRFYVFFSYLFLLLFLSYHFSSEFWCWCNGPFSELFFPENSPIWDRATYFEIDFFVLEMTVGRHVVCTAYCHVTTYIVLYLLINK